MSEKAPRVLTPADLAYELGVSVQALQGAIARGVIVPTFRTASGRARFDRQYAEELKRRAELPRAKGAVRVLKTQARPAPAPAPARPSAVAFARQTAWKRTGLR
jgi:hypothetical protein